MSGNKPAENGIRTLDPDTVVGHDRILSFLDRAVSSGRLAHAYLFIGPEHVGKMTVAKRLAAAVLGSGAPLDRHPDFLTVSRGCDPKSGKMRADIVLDQIHALRGWLARGALMGGWKAVAVEDAQFLNKEAANALLKNLEEPKTKTLMMLLADSGDNVFPTIRSRCQVMNFGRVRTEVIARDLAEQGSSPERAALLARLSAGCPGKARDYAHRPEMLAEMEARRELLLSLPGSGIADRWAVLDKVVPAKLPFNEAARRAVEVLDLLAELLRDALLAAYGHGEAMTHVDVRHRVAAWSSAFGAKRIAAVLQEITDSKRLLGENVNPRAVLESLVLSFN